MLTVATMGPERHAVTHHTSREKALDAVLDAMTAPGQEWDFIAMWEDDAPADAPAKQAWGLVGSRWQKAPLRAAAKDFFPC